MSAGDEVYLLDGSSAFILGSDFEELNDIIHVYNLEVEDFHSYFVGENSILVHNKCEIEEGTNFEIYYRTMSAEDYDYLRMTGELPATCETFISPTLSFSSDYDGVTVKFKLSPGTTNSLLDVGVGDGSKQCIKDYGNLPHVFSGWNINNAYFKGEGKQTNIGLGKGKGLEIFNINIQNFESVGGN